MKANTYSWQRNARKLFPHNKPTRPAGFTMYRGQILVDGFDQSIVMVFSGKDLYKMQTMLTAVLREKL